MRIRDTFDQVRAHWDRLTVRERRYIMTLVGCAGAAVEASGGTLSLSGVDAIGGSGGCIVLVNGARADLSGNLCGGRGPGLVLADGARATARVNRWWTDPVFWVDCGSGARVELGRGETSRAPCAAAR